MTAPELPSVPEAAALPGHMRDMRPEHWLAAVCAVLLSASVFLLLGRGAAGSAARLALLLLPLAGVLAWLFLPTMRRPRTPSSGVLSWIGLPLASYFAAAAVVRQIHGSDVSFLDKPVRSLLVALGLLVWLHVRMDGAMFRRVVIASSMLAGPFALAVALYEHFVLGVGRVGAQVHPIQFADMAMSVALVCIVWAVVLRSPKIRLLAVVAACCAFGSIWMTASRGAFLAMLTLPWIVAYAYGRRLSSRIILQVTAAVVLANGLALAVSPGLRERVAEVQTDLQAYSHGNAATSVGWRLQMWQNAYGLFKSAPLAGVGSEGYLQSGRDGVAAGRLDPAVLEFNGAHNQYLDALARGGLILGLATCAVFVFPLLWFWRQSRRPRGNKAFAVAGFALASAFPLYALTQHVFNHGTGMMFFAGGIALMALATVLPAMGHNSGNPAFPQEPSP